MGSLPEKVRDLPLSMIAIPGTHDSATYKLQTHMVIAPDFSEFKRLNKQPYTTMASAAISAFAPLKDVISAWGKCVKQNTYEQLMLGIRYFDFRPMGHIGMFMHETSTWNAHSLYADRTSHEFGQIKDFLTMYPSEIVILDMNGGWYAMSDAHYASLEAEIKHFFGSMLCNDAYWSSNKSLFNPLTGDEMLPLDPLVKRSRDATPGSYNKLRSENCNVIVRYGGVPDDKKSKVPYFAIGGDDLKSPWINHNKAEVDPCSDADLELYKRLDEERHWEWKKQGDLKKRGKK